MQSQKPLGARFIVSGSILVIRYQLLGIPEISPVRNPLITNN